MKKAPKRTKPSQNEAVKELAEVVGNFIRYWGFRRIHGQLWTQIFLSKQPLSGAELVKRLHVSKALVSPALAELQHHRLIECLEFDGRTKAYKANPDVFKVIKGILKEREKRLIQEAREKFEILLEASDEGSKENLDQDRLHALGEMIGAAEFALDFVIQSSNSESLPNWSLLEQAFQEGKEI